MNLRDKQIPDDRLCFHGNPAECSLRHFKSAAKEIIGLKAKGVGGMPNEMLINMHILLFFKASPVWLCSTVV